MKKDHRDTAGVALPDVGQPDACPEPDALHVKNIIRFGRRSDPPVENGLGGREPFWSIGATDSDMQTDPSREDPELLAAVAGGDLVAMRLLYDRHAPWLSARLTRRCNSPEAVADVLQDTFVALWKGAESWRGEGEVAAWLWGIAIRRLVSRLRGRREALVLPLEEVAAAGAPEASTEDLVLLGIEYGDLGAALGRLSPQMRAVVQATVLDGLTTREAARLLDIPANTVKTRLHRAKARLRQDLTEEMA